MLVSEPSGKLTAQLQGWALADVLCSDTVLTGVVRPSTSSGTAEHGALGLLICVSDKLIYPYWALVLHTWLKTAQTFHLRGKCPSHGLE